jgi:hypothetical protein
MSISFYFLVLKPVFNLVITNQLPAPLCLTWEKAQNVKNGKHDDFTSTGFVLPTKFALTLQDLQNLLKQISASGSTVQ